MSRLSCRMGIGMGGNWELLIGKMGIGFKFQMGMGMGMKSLKRGGGFGTILCGRDCWWNCSTQGLSILCCVMINIRSVSSSIVCRRQVFDIIHGQLWFFCLLTLWPTCVQTSVIQALGAALHDADVYPQPDKWVFALHVDALAVWLSW